MTELSRSAGFWPPPQYQVTSSADRAAGSVRVHRHGRNGTRNFAAVGSGRHWTREIMHIACGPPVSERVRGGGFNDLVAQSASPERVAKQHEARGRAAPSAWLSIRFNASRNR